jgi:hypothetical protein
MLQGLAKCLMGRGCESGLEHRDHLWHVVVEQGGFTVFGHGGVASLELDPRQPIAILQGRNGEEGWVFRQLWGLYHGVWVRRMIRL